MKLLKNFMLYGLSNAWGSGVSYLLILFLTGFISPAGIGLITNFQYLAYLIIPLIGISAGGAVTREFYNKSLEFSKLLWQTFWLIIASILVLSIVFLLADALIAELTELPILFVWLSLVFAIAFQAVELKLAVFRLRDRAFHFAGLKIGRGIMEVIITIGGVWVLFPSWTWRVYALIGVNILLAMWIALNLVRIPFSWPDKGYLKQILKFSLPLVPNAIIVAIMGFTDKLFVTNYLGIAENGIYSVAFQLGMIVSLLQNSFNQAWVPWFYKSMSEEIVNQRSILSKAFYFALGFLAIVILIVIVSPLIIQLFNDAYQFEIEVLLYVMTGFYFHGIYKIFVNYLFFHRKTQLVLVMSAITATLNFFLNWWLVPNYGLQGAAIATMASFIIQFLITASIVQYNYRLPWLSLLRND